MKCPHCLEVFHESENRTFLRRDKDGEWFLIQELCPSCERFIFQLELESLDNPELSKKFLVYPKGISRSLLSQDVPSNFADDYKEACLVLTDSPKASAALSRRRLQKILREKAGVTPQDLSKEIDEVLSTLPTHLSNALAVVRVIGNFAAHPTKSKSTGEIIEVEPGEAEWLLDVLEGLFDFYFVQPAEFQRKKDALNQKLTDAGKPTI